MKTKKRNYIFLAVLMMGIATMMTGCAVERDNPAATTPLGDKIVGKWYAETPKQVTLGTGKNAVECAKVVLVGTFDADGEGFWSYILVDKQNRAIQPVGKDGKEHPYYANCQYSVAGNNVDVELTANYLPTSQMEWTFNYNGTCLQTKYEDRLIDLHPITTEEDAMFQEWMQQLGFGAEMVDFNINDKDITAENWRQTEGIYIYDGVGADVTDEKGRTGYTLVALPWYQGDKLTNLPNGFCDDVTPEMGWEWVINRCGNRSIVGNNFFAVYNKYTGILRFFYYLPQGFSTGNDHVWQVSMTDNLATRTTIPYGVPEDRKLVNKAAINQTGQGTYMEYVTPWADYLSQDGLIVPNAGWWAFDVDLSLTRPEALAEDNSIKLQMRSWNTQHASLYSTIDANIDGTMQGTFEGKTPVQVSSSKGFFGKVGDFIKIGKQVKDVIASYKEGNYIGAIKGGIGAAKSGMSLASGKPKTTGGDPLVDGTFEGTLNLMLKGTINTDGVISGSQPTVGIASPTFNFKDFDTKNTHLGQGVWNLKKTPVVYRTNLLYRQKADESLCIKPAYLQLSDEYEVPWDFYDWEQFYFFDPSSIEVELNPNVFPESEIEWMQVDAINGVRKAMLFTGTDAHLQALGIEKTEMDMRYRIKKPAPGCFDIFQDYYNYESYDIKHGGGSSLTFPYCYDYSDSDAEQADCVYDKDSKTDFSITWLIGRGTDNYAIEPAYSVTMNNPNAGIKGKVFKIPAFEISVTLTVKLKNIDTPFVFSRLYLPEVKNLNIDNLGSIIENMTKKTNLSPYTADHTDLYDWQVARLQKINKDKLYGDDLDGDNDK